MSDDRDWSWLGPKHPAPREVDAPVHALWSLTKRTHRVDCGVRATPSGPEIRINLNGELWWSRVYRGATEETLTAEADRKRDEFIAKGWAP